MARPSVSSDGPTTQPPNAPTASPTPDGSTALPTADAATCKPTAVAAPPSGPPSPEPPVISVISGNTGAAARPSTTIPATAKPPGRGSAISSAPPGTPTTARASTRDAPARCATGPSSMRPANIIAQYADTTTPAATGDSPRPDVRNAYPQMPAADSTPVSTAVNSTLGS